MSRMPTPKSGATSKRCEAADRFSPRRRIFLMSSAILDPELAKFKTNIQRRWALSSRGRAPPVASPVALQGRGTDDRADFIRAAQKLAGDDSPRAARVARHPRHDGAPDLWRLRLHEPRD